MRCDSALPYPSGHQTGRQYGGLRFTEARTGVVVSTFNERPNLWREFEGKILWVKGWISVAMILDADLRFIAPMCRRCRPYCAKRKYGEQNPKKMPRERVIISHEPPGARAGQSGIARFVARQGGFRME